MLIFALALVAIASMVAYGLTVSVQASATSSKGFMVNGLAESAAQMGVRHAMDVITADYLDPAIKVTSPVGSHWTTFMDHGQNDMNHLANPASRRNLSRFALLDPNYSATDNVPYESRFHLQFFEFAGGWDNTSSAYKTHNDNSTWGNDGIQTSMLSTGSAKYIEPGFYSTKANNPANARKFSDTSAAPATDFINSPSYYDSNWKPTSDRSKARYRLRYAVTAMDLGGHLIWGRQADYPAASTEWDRDLAKNYNFPFFNMLGGINIGDVNNPAYPPRPTVQTMFLGYGTPMAQWVPPYRHDVNRLIIGFSPTGCPLLATTANMPGYIEVFPPPSTTPPIVPYPNRGFMSVNNQGGPWSWTHAAILTQSGGWTMTPFGRASDPTAIHPTTHVAKYYYSRSSSPWRINALTVPAHTFKWMIHGYLPPQVLRPNSGALTPGNKYFQGQSNRFSPPEGSPFASFISPDYSQTVPSYTGAYPDDPANWEDYAAMETTPANLQNSALVTETMLGGDVDVFHYKGIDRGTWYWRNYGDQKYSAAREPIHGFFGKMIEPIHGDMARDINVNVNPYFHRDSYWLDLAHALAGTIVTAKCTYLDAASCGATATINANLIAKPTTPRELDILFLSMLGEYFTDDAVKPGSSASATPKTGVSVVRKWSLPAYCPADDTSFVGWTQGPTEMIRSATSTVRANILKVKTDNAAVANMARKAANMELVLNDMRMSFFGANYLYCPDPVDPTTPDTSKPWRPLDFDGDGWANSSSYAAVNPTAVGGKNFPGCAVVDGTGVAAPDFYWSLTGYFTMEKARYWRVITRGEVWDDLIKQPISEANYEAVFVVDPEGTGTVGQTQTLYGHWLQNYYRGLQAATVQ